MVSVIMAGGVGQRFWPRSRRRAPKQLLVLTGGATMIASTVDRVSRVSSPEEIFILTNAMQVDAITAAVAGRVPAANIVAEPVGRNTAPAVALGALLVRRRFGDVPFMVLPADHIVGDLDRYEDAIRTAERQVTTGDVLVTFGITPTRPETGYGYIEAGERISAPEELGVYRVSSFLEKPDRKVAERFVSDRSYLWNSGMFLWRAKTVLGAIEKYMPELRDVLHQVDAAIGTERFVRVLNDVYPSAPSISIDYGVMERADNVVVVRGDFYWNDVGSWESVRDLYESDAESNVLVGDHVVVDSQQNTVFAPERAVALVGIKDLIVIDSGDALLVCHRDRAQDVRRVVEALEDEGKEGLY